MTSTKTDRARALVNAWRKDGRTGVEQLSGETMDDATWPAIEAKLREAFPNG